MRRITITHQNVAYAERYKRTCHKNPARNHTRRFGKDLRCTKCGKSLKVGETAYRTPRKYLCQECGKNAEIEV